MLNLQLREFVPLVFWIFFCVAFVTNLVAYPVLSLASGAHVETFANFDNYIERCQPFQS